MNIVFIKTLFVLLVSVFTIKFLFAFSTALGVCVIVAIINTLVWRVYNVQGKRRTR